MDISNKTLAMILVAAIAVSFFGTLISLGTIRGMTGYATSGAGNATLYLNSTSSIRFAVANINWGSVSVNSSASYCNLTSTGQAAGCESFTNVTQGFVLENDGNTNVSVTLQSNASAAQFLGSGAFFLWKIADNETSSCSNEYPTAYANVNSTEAETICGALLPNDPSDTLRIDLNVAIPLALQSSAGNSQKTATITATAS